VPLKDSTRDLIAGRELDLMKQGAFLVNLARGGVVNEADLLRSLESGRLAGAGLDVHEREGNGNISPFAHLDNVILTPHIGAGTTDTQEEIGDVIVRCIEHAEQNPPIEKAIEANFIIM
jgi:phosphoglycerate dehydrogenase-like enzyme